MQFWKSIFITHWQREKIPKNENIDKKKIPDKFWVDKGHPISPRGSPMGFKGQKFILKNWAPKIMKFCEYMCFKAINSNSSKKWPT